MAECVWQQARAVGAGMAQRIWQHTVRAAGGVMAQWVGQHAAGVTGDAEICECPQTAECNHEPYLPKRCRST